MKFRCEDGDCEYPCEACITRGPNINFEEVPEFEQRLDRVLAEIKETLIKKNHDYGDSFAKQYKKYGLTSYLIRDEDKTLRLESLQTKDALVDESVRDTVLDKAGYAILALVTMGKPS